VTGRALLLVAGEASGDLHAARLLGELRPLVPEFEAFGLGGDELAAAGQRRLAESREIAVVGISEALRILPRAREIFRTILSEVDRVRPAAAVLVDFPEFNLRLAAALKKRGVPVIYYISPQVWAWRQGRVRKIRRTVDELLVLFDFEEAFFRDRGVAVVHVGHPLIDEVPDPGSLAGRLPAREGPHRLALLPGSRRSEIDHLLPAMLGAVEVLRRDRPVEARIVRAPSVDLALLTAHMERSGVEVPVVSEGRFAEIAESDLALCASGTATLEVGLLGTPMVVVYRLARGSMLLARLLVDLPHFSLVNLVLRRCVVPELLQEKVNPQSLAAAARGLLDDPARRLRMREELAELRSHLGEPGAARRAAERVAGHLRRRAEWS
jgi:lipid-A-disaccharide synthase